MAHEVETAWMGGGVAAWWDRQKNYVQADLMDPDEALEKGGINWPVYLYPILLPDDQETEFNVVVREREIDGEVKLDALATVGPRYNPLQNEQLMEYMMAITQAGYGLKIESAMSLKGGKVVAICARRPEAVRIADQDHLQYFTGANWHDGTRKAVVYASNVRTVCANTLAFGLASAPNVFKFTHTGNMEGKIEEAKQKLELTFKYQDRVAEIGNELALKKMSKKQFEDFLKKAAPVKSDDDQAQITRMMNTRDGIRQVYADSPDLQNITGTPWGAIQAVAEFNDHKRNWESADNRFVQAVVGSDLNQRAFEVIRKQYQIA